jgi:hypothetical protein
MQEHRIMLLGFALNSINVTQEETQDEKKISRVGRKTGRSHARKYLLKVAAGE